MSKTIIASRYAKAFFDHVGEDLLEYVDGELRLVGDLFATRQELITVLASPTISDSDKEAFLSAILKQIQPCEEVDVFIRLLLKKERINVIIDIYKEFHELVDEKKNYARAELRTAFSLDQKQISKIREKLEKMARKNLDIDVVNDESLIAGISVKINDIVYEFNMMNDFNKLRRTMLGA